MSPALLKKLALSCVLLLAFWLIIQYAQVPRGKNPYAKAFAGAQDIQLQEGNGRLYFHNDKQKWTVAENTAGPVYPVDEERWHTFSSGLQDVQLEDIISERKENAGDFQVDASSGMRVTLRNSKSEVLVDGVFGKQAPDGTHIYFRYADQDTVYLAHGLFRGELGGTDLEPWRVHSSTPTAGAPGR